MATLNPIQESDIARRARGYWRADGDPLAFGSSGLLFIRKALPVCLVWAALFSEQATKFSYVRGSNCCS